MSRSTRTWTYRIAAMFAVAATLTVTAAVGGFASDKDSELTTTQGLLSLIESESEDYLLVDVRTAGEFASGHIPTAINIPYQSIVRDLPAGSKDRLIIVYCRTGNRSGSAERWLRRAGYTNVVDFGGILSWRGPVVVPRTGE